MKKLVLPVALLLFSSAFVIYEGDLISQLREHIDVYNRTYKRAKIDLFFNQPKYSPGDTALIRTLYLQAADLKPVVGRQIIHIDLMDDTGNLVLANQVLVTNGFASTQLAIPEELSPGFYAVIAYSDWMKNMDSTLFFKQDFLVTGKEALGTTAEEPTLKFFPEGGSLIAGVQNNLLIQFTGEYQNLKAVIHSDSGVIATVSPDSSGLIELKIIPRPAHYYAECVIKGQTRKFDLPVPKAAGFAVEASVSSTGSIKVRLEPSRTLDFSRKYFLVIAGNKGIIYSRALEALVSGPMEWALPEELPSGVVQILIVDERLNFWAQRTISIGNKTNYRVAVKHSKKIYSTREGVDVELEVTDKMGNPVHGNYTVRIINRDLFEGASRLHQGNYLQLFSDVSSPVRAQVPVSDEGINRFLISQPCPWLDWDRVLATKSVSPTFRQQRSLVISGQLLQLETGKPVPDSTQVMFFLRNQIFGYEVYTNGKGQFDCPLLFDFEGNDEVFFAAVHKGKDINNLVIRLDKQDSIHGFKPSPWHNLHKEDAYGVYEFRKNLIDRSFNYFSGRTQNKDSIDDPNAAIEDELQGADLILKTSDYIVFPTMPDLIREVLRSVEYRRIGGRDVVRIYTTGKRPTNFAGPLYVIDGVLTKNPSAFLNLKPSDILTIKVVKNSNKLAKFGSMGANGVILVRTRNSARKSAVHQENTFLLAGMSPGFSEKMNPRNSGQTNPSIPDLRPCLYWCPRGILDSNGASTIHFVTSDDVGNFVIEVEGLTADGNPFFAVDTIQVKYHQP